MAKNKLPMKVVETEKYNRVFADFNQLTSPVTPEEFAPQKLPSETVKTKENEETETVDANKSPIPEGTEALWRYGNYCGPGPLRVKTCDKLINGKPLPGAKDIVDQACMDHDLAYCENGLGWKDAYLLDLKPAAANADQVLIKRLKDLFKSEQLNWKQKMAAITIVSWFSLRAYALSRSKSMTENSQNPTIQSLELPSSGTV